jgi:hypothetical protein
MATMNRRAWVAMMAGLVAWLPARSATKPKPVRQWYIWSGIGGQVRQTKPGVWAGDAFCTQTGRVFDYIEVTRPSATAWVSDAPDDFRIACSWSPILAERWNQWVVCSVRPRLDHGGIMRKAPEQHWVMGVRRREPITFEMKWS